MIVTAHPPDPVAFAPFGAFVEPPTEPGTRAPFEHWLMPVAGLSQHAHLNRVAPSTLPLTFERVERHPHAAQLFLPIDGSRYLVTVFPSDAEGAPDVGGALSFVVPGDVGVVYQPDTWHAGITALDREASFAVLMWRGRADDDVFATIPTVEVRATGRSLSDGPMPPRVDV